MKPFSGHLQVATDIIKLFKNKKANVTWLISSNFKMALLIVVDSFSVLWLFSGDFVFSLVINQSLVLRFSFYSLNVLSCPVANVWPCKAPI